MKILVLQLKRIGDLILSTPMLFALRENFPDAHITLAVESGSRELLPAIDCVNATLIYNRAKSNAALWRKLIFTSYDVCLDLTGNDRSALFSVLSKAKKRAAFQWVQKSPVRSIFYNNFVNSPVRESHTINHYLHMLRAVGARPRDTPVTLHLPEWSHKKAQQLLDERSVSGPFFVVHPGTARPEKYWLAERWAEVVEFCERELGLRCVITGGKDPVEMEHVGKIKSFLHNPEPVADLCGCLDLLTLSALIQRAALVLTVDSAPMHLASAFARPQVALFGPTNPFHWYPRHEKACVLVAGQPDPVRKFLPLAKGEEMSLLMTGHVVNTIASLLHPNVIT